MRVGISHGPGWFPVAVQALVVLAEAEHYLLELLSHHTLASILERVAISGRLS